jgi:hypothetical protein
MRDTDLAPQPLSFLNADVCSEDANESVLRSSLQAGVINVEDVLVIETKAIDKFVDVRTKGRDSLSCIDARWGTAERRNVPTNVAMIDVD